MGSRSEFLWRLSVSWFKDVRRGGGARTFAVDFLLDSTKTGVLDSTVTSINCAIVSS
jgi:hypothetical protein